MNRFNTIQEIMLKAYREMPSSTWDHLMGGSESETTLHRNRQALDSVAFRPRILRKVLDKDISTIFLDKKIRIPVFLAPIGSIEQIVPNGSAISLKAAADFGVIYFQSCVNQLSIEEAAVIAGEHNVYQPYMLGDDAWFDNILEKVSQTDFRGFCLTVDTAMYSRRERDLINIYTPIGRENGDREGYQYQANMNWDVVDKIKDRLDIPLIIKGISTAEDARIALEHGVDVIYVSNHGGRQLDHCRGSLEVLPEIVDAVQDNAKIVIDSGFVRGTDILKALAMGAQAVGIGRLFVLALFAGGGEGVIRMLEILEEEIMVGMGLLGITRLDQLNTDYICSASPVSRPSAFSPFPSLERLISTSEGRNI